MYIYLRKKKENSNKWFSKIAFVIFKFWFYLLNYCLCIKQFRCVPVFHEINEKCVVEAIFSPILPYQLVILPFENTKRKETDQETMNFLPIFISFEFNDFHDYKVLINSFPVYVFSILQLLTFLPFACLVIRRTMKFFFIYTAQVYK